MRMTRTHVELPLSVGEPLELPDDVAGHLGRVLRLKVGDSFVLFNGDGNDYTATLSEIDKRRGRALVIGSEVRDNESPLQIRLLQSIARGEKMDWILQKATELGVDSVQPVYSQRGEVRLDEARTAKRLQHWRQVVISACEQSGRAQVPQVLPPIDVSRLQLTEEMRLLLEPGAKGRIADIRERPSSIALAIGPEGGWSEIDLGHLKAAQFTGVSLGPRVLRTETAGLAAIAALQCQLGDF